METNIENVTRRVLQHIYRQPFKARDFEGSCKYRMEREGKTLKCFVGALIADEKYDKELEGKPVDTLDFARSLKWLLDLPSEPTVNDILYLKHLQELHDSTSPETWVNKILHLKKIYTSTEQ